MNLGCDVEVGGDKRKTTVEKVEDQAEMIEKRSRSRMELTWLMSFDYVLSALLKSCRPEANRLKARDKRSVSKARTKHLAVRWGRERISVREWSLGPWARRVE